MNITERSKQYGNNCFKDNSHKNFIAANGYLVGALEQRAIDIDIITKYLKDKDINIDEFIKLIKDGN